ncbi:glycoside hydrolase family 67 protein [Zasmidium cellare ATCC 36951]|uniref:Alpha-glucuronidase n=1 Tax=Zasmidium cellare ATCC 36951 TaxID=1080233 RepID=A0A6A6CBU4_ZASCE|nr:glycoside hydrolase family 67 protein [Zasmidium cellare ATCC 36951]KAF2163139.1 glycoside hydrolase family 67 protein [Zasmidium cellare ATCC 36951]
MLKLLFLFVFIGLVAGEDGLQAWLRYAPLPRGHHRSSLPSRIVALNDSSSSPVYTAGQELQKGILGILGEDLEICDSAPAGNSAILVGTVGQYNKVYQDATLHPDLSEDGFWLSTQGTTVRILGQNERGVLYGAFEYLSMLAQGNFSTVEYPTNPSAPIRWTNEWDNMDGSIERGFAGNSIFFDDGAIVANLTRAAEYARLLASIRVNAVIVNNVNANYTTLQPDNIEGLGRIADVFRPYGVQLGMSLYFASPANITNLTTYDPLDSRVIAFWNDKTDEIYQRIPDMAGYLVKANSEGQPGPIQYNRTLAQGANLFAKALKPHGGILMFRAFVYDQLNESDWKADRAKAAVDYFQPLDGDFDDNVVVQIKYGPIDFQVREPVSPLFANLRNTSTAIELQVTQEYLGQQCHVIYLPPLWKTITNFDLRVDNSTSLVRNIMTGQHFDRPLGGSAGVVNVGQNTTWLGSHLAMSNLYAYGRLAWDWTADPTEILQDWIRLTFGHNQQVIDTITEMSLASWPAYENYSGNLGIQTLTDILYTHFGPNPQSQDNNGWGQWTRADKASIGMDRTVSNGTGYSGQYPPEIASLYEDISTTPDDLLLWFHHVNYTHTLTSGKSVIQHFYDAHYAGALTAHSFVGMWESLKPYMDTERYDDVLFRQKFQAGHALVWRDAITNFYHNLSGIPDEAGRVGHHPWRIEAESMRLSGYEIYAVAPFETASNATAIVTRSNSTTGTASTTIAFDSGVYDLAINYYDMYGGNSTYEVCIGDQVVAKWTGDIVDTGKLGHTPSIYLDGHSATRVTFPDVKIQKGDVLTIKGTPDGIEPAPVDYVALLPRGVVD